MHNTLSEYRGRFAPSPSGSLHFGSLIAATASYLDAKANQGKWLLRIEDLDQPRVQAGAIRSIIRLLEAYGFEWDEEILYQSQRFSAYESAINELSLSKHIYPCCCTRKQIKQTATMGPYGLIYAGTCRRGMPISAGSQQSTRLITHNDAISFEDRLQGEYVQHLSSEIGDFVLKRSDGIYAYQLAVVVDDDYQKISDIVRGNDLLDNTARQIYLQQLLGYKQPRYLHFPIALDENGNKLSKTNHAPEAEIKDGLKNIHKSLQFLGQMPPKMTDFAHITDLWNWAIDHWDYNKIMR